MLEVGAAPDSDSDTDTDTDETTPLPLDWHGGTATGLTIGLFSTVEVDDGFGVDDEVQSWPAGSDIELPALSEEDLDPVSDIPGLLIALQMLAVYDDTDGDGQHDAGNETIYGWASLLPTYLGGEIPNEFVLMGASEGWNLLSFSTEDGTPTFGAVSEGSDVIVYDPHPGLVLGGTSNDLAPAALAALVPTVMFEGAEVEALGDGESASAWSFEIDADPPSDHLSWETDESGVAVAVASEVVLAYLDVNGSEKLDEGDAPLATACEGDRAVAALFLAPFAHFPRDFFMYAQILQPGWQLVKVMTEESQMFEPVEDPTHLVLDAEACTLGE